MKYVFHPEALIEFKESALYYTKKNSKLGLAFYIEVVNTIDKILKTPARYRIIEEDVRRCLTKRFPYGILYTIEEDYILIIAVMHCSREPYFWKNRINKK